jgi:hypothetical protein
MKRRKHKKHKATGTTTKRRKRSRKHAKHAKKHHAKAVANVSRKSKKINGDRYMKNKVLVFKMRTQIRHELSDDAREIKNLGRLLKRARRFAA